MLNKHNIVAIKEASASSVNIQLKTEMGPTN